MFSEIISPRFSDTDALGHINNTTLPIWFEGARTPIFQMFTQALDLNDWPLILAKIDVTFEAQIYYGKGVEIRTFISRIGGASFDVYQEVWQENKRVAFGTAVMVRFNHHTQASEKISKEVVEQLQKHLFDKN